MGLWENVSGIWRGLFARGKKVFGLEQKMFVMFLAVGVFCSVVDILLFLVLFEFRPNYSMIGTFSFVCASVLNFFLSRKIFSQGRNQLVLEAMKFAVLLSFGSAIVYLVLVVWDLLIDGNYVVGKVFSGLLLLIIGYVGRRRFVFSE